MESDFDSIRLIWSVLGTVVMLELALPAFTMAVGAMLVLFTVLVPVLGLAVCFRVLALAVFLPSMWSCPWGLVYL